MNPDEEASGEMTARDDNGVAEGRRRLAECPADPQLVTMPQGELARLAVRLHGAGQLLDAQLKDSDAESGVRRVAVSQTAFTLDQDQARTVMAALEDAAALRRETAGYCWYCTQSHGGLCPDHEGSPQAADAYDALRWQLEPALTPEPLSTPGPAIQHDGRGGQPAGTTCQHDQGEAALTTPMQGPECGEPTANPAPGDLAPRQSHGMQRPERSHPDGSTLCPVLGPSGGYKPAQPVAAGETGADSARLDPPPSMRRQWASPHAAREAEPG